MTKRAGIYCRISRDREGAGLGVDRQEQDCRKLATDLGWTIVGVYRDNDISAYSGKPRPDYDKLLADLRSGHVNAVIAWHSDRLHRRPAELEEYISVCEATAAPTATVTASPLDLTTPSGRMVARMLGAAARGEVEHSIERIKRAKLQAAVTGKYRGGRRPFGYARDGVTVLPEEATEIVKAADALLSGMSVRAITADLNARGIRTSTGAAWHPIKVREMLLRPRNAGLVDHDGQIVCENAEWPPVLDKDTWRGVVALLSDPTRRTAPGGAPRWMLSGIARCGADGCGAPMVIHSQRSSTRPNQKPAYGCKAFHVMRDAAQLDEHVSTYVIERLMRPDAFKLLAQDSPVDTTALHIQVLALRQQLDELGLLYARRQLDARQVAVASQDLRNQLAMTEREIATASHQSVFAGIVGADDVPGTWEAWPLDRKRAAIRALVMVTVHKARRGRPPGWKAGDGYFDPAAVSVRPIEAPPRG